MKYGRLIMNLSFFISVLSLLNVMLDLYRFRLFLFKIFHLHNSYINNINHLDFGLQKAYIVECVETEVDQIGPGRSATWICPPCPCPSPPCPCPSRPRPPCPYPPCPCPPSSCPPCPGTKEEKGGFFWHSGRRRMDGRTETEGIQRGPRGPKK